MQSATSGKITRSIIFSVFAALAIPAAVPASAAGVKASTANVVQVSNTTELLTALNQAREPITILLTRGAWGGLKLKDLSVPYGTIVRSADVEQPALFDGVTLSNVRGLTLSGIVIKPPASGPVAGRYGVLVIGCRDVLLDKIALHAPLSRSKAPAVTAMMLRNSSDVTVQQSYFTGYQHGIAMLNLENSLIEMNEFEDLRTDAIRGGGVNRTRIANNVITGFNPARGDHPDGIQLWSTRQRRPAKDVDIVDNLVVRGSGDPIQGIFIRDTRLRLPFEEVTISGNLIIGGLYNGITVLGARRLNLHSNAVIAQPDQRSWIRVEYTRDAVASNNSAYHYVIRNNRTRPVLRNNDNVAATDENFAASISQWVESKPAFASYRGAVLQRLMATGS